MDKEYTTAERLSQIMRERSLKQVDILELAKPFIEKYNIKLARNDLSQYVSGKVNPGQHKLFILANALNVNEAWLMGYDVPIERTDIKTGDNSEIHNSGMIGTVNGGKLTFKTGSPEFADTALNRQEQDLLRIFREADGKHQTKIMQYIYEIEDEINKKKG